MRYFKTKDLKKWARRERVTDVHLMQVYAEFIEGLYEADLGNGLFKKRIGLGNKGKSGGGRIILFYKIDDAVVFCMGYSKSEKDNITQEEKDHLKVLADLFRSFNDKKYDLAVEKEVLFEIE